MRSAHSCVQARADLPQCSVFAVACVGALGEPTFLSRQRLLRVLIECAVERDCFKESAQDPIVRATKGSPQPTCVLSHAGVCNVGVLCPPYVRAGTWLVRPALHHVAGTSFRPFRHALERAWVRRICCVLYVLRRDILRREIVFSFAAQSTVSKKAPQAAGTSSFLDTSHRSSLAKPPVGVFKTGGEPGANEFANTCLCTMYCVELFAFCSCAFGERVLGAFRARGIGTGGVRTAS